MNLEYQSAADVTRYLGSTVCRYEKEPVLVSAVGSLEQVGITTLQGCPKKEEFAGKLIYLSDPLFVVKSPPLGFCNIDNGVQYLVRTPVRVCVQGLSTNNVTDLLTNRRITGGMLVSAAFRNCLLGKYPSFNEAFSKVTSYENVATAFAQHLCITRVGRAYGIMHRARVVAQYVPKVERFELLPSLRDGSFISRLLLQHGVPL